ncbi:MAG TPA: SDR family NAD(P)-dependent oxidoreductase, partial [Flavobacteriaceae bacterium]
MNLNLKNKNALVCGSTAGIGKATAIALSNEGVNVTLIARNEDKLKEVLSQLSSGGKHNYIVADFSNPEELRQKVSLFINDFPLRGTKGAGFHILVNNTGGPRSGDILTATLEQFENTFAQHLKCNHVLAQAVVPFM